MHSTVKRLILGLLIPAIAVAAFMTALRYKPGSADALEGPLLATPSPLATPIATPSPELIPTPATEETPLPESSASPQEAPAASPTPASNYVGELKLIIPVVGVRANQLVDTFDDARSEGRVHMLLIYQHLEAR